jgi:hypothetical protein
VDSTTSLQVPNFYPKLYMLRRGNVPIVRLGNRHLPRRLRGNLHQERHLEEEGRLNSQAMERLESAYYEVMWDLGSVD